MWDIHILGREGAALGCSKEEVAAFLSIDLICLFSFQVSRASALYSRSSDAEKNELTATILKVRLVNCPLSVFVVRSV